MEEAQDSEHNESQTRSQSFAQQSPAPQDGSANRHARRHSGSALLDSVDEDGGSVGASSWAPPSPDPRVMDHSFASEPPRLSPRPPPTTEEKTLQNQVLAGTLELLKLAGGVTLSTTGKLAGPPLHVTRTMLLPALWGGLCDYVDQVTPQRVKDWSRILSSSVHHFVTVLKNTQKGLVLQQKLCIIGVDLLDSFSCDASRQMFVDGMAAFVKLSEALRTPETKLLLDRLSVLGCRLVDAAASGRNKKLMHDVSDAVWSGLELFADPKTTAAFAEVTAYLCYALEMEDALHREKPVGKQRAAQRRYQRNAYQKQTYVDPNLTQDANSTVEQVILSSLGGAENEDEGSSFPSNVVLSQAVDSGSGAENWRRGESEDFEEGLDWRERAGDDVDLSLLHERISARAVEMQRQSVAHRRPPGPVDTSFAQQPNPTVPQDPADESEQKPEEPGKDIEEVVVTTVDENDDDVEYVEETRQSEEAKATRHAGNLEYEKKETEEHDELQEWLSENLSSAEEPPVVAGESASNRFYRRLDEIMVKKRAEAVTDILKQLGGDKGLSWYPRAAAAAGAGNERGQDTIKKQVAAIRNAARSEIGVGHEALKRAAQKIEEQPVTTCFVLFVGTMSLLWFVLGLYGCYALVFASYGTSAPPVLPASSGNLQQEIVVRIVREVVHVGADGNVVQSNQYPPLSENAADDVAACVARAME